MTTIPLRILLVAPPSQAEAVASGLREQLRATVEIAPHRRAALSALRRGSYALVVMEEALADLDARETDVLYQNADGASVLEVSFRTNSSDRVVRQARATLRHRAKDAKVARAAAVRRLQSELSSSLTALLLESQLALLEAAPPMQPKLRHVVELAGKLRSRLRTE